MDLLSKKIANLAINHQKKAVKIPIQKVMQVQNSFNSKISYIDYVHKHFSDFQ